MSNLTQSTWNHASAAAASGSFVPAELLGRLDVLSPAEFDRAEFGVVRLSDGGIVEIYNRYESQLAGLAPNDVLGRNFFTQIAPCTNNKLFKGAFAKGVEAGAMNLVFAYTFTYRMAPTEVQVHLYRAKQTNWLFIKKS